MRYRGFTLIEVMVALAVLAILLAVGLPGEGIIWLCSRFSSKAQKGEKHEV